MIEIDGSAGEGGGQILRTALALSMITGQPFRVRRIRARRPKPGLMRQHLTCVQAATAVSGAEVQGAELNSQELSFAPGRICAGDYDFNVGSAGSCTLVLQTIWPALMFADAPSTVKLKGGTHNPMAPPFHFLERAYAPLLARLGARSELALRRLGFYPAGGGEIEASLWPAAEALQPLDILERGNGPQGWAESLIPALPRTVAERELAHLGMAMGWSAEQLRVGAFRQNEGPGNALLATLQYDNVCEVFTRLGEKGVSAEQVAQDLVDEIRRYQTMPGALGPHLADQWALPLSLAVWKKGGAAAYSCTEITEHSRTNFAMIEKFLPVSISYKGTEGGFVVKVKVS